MFAGKKRIRIIALLFSQVIILSCNKNSSVPDWEWIDSTNNTTNNVDKPRFIWVDAVANFADFANHKENILRDLTLAKNAGFTDVVVDVRPTTGDVLFTTDVVSQVKWLGVWLSAGYTKVERTATWDYLQTFIDIGHGLGLKIHAGVNTMVGGNKTNLGTEGVLFREQEKRKWATQLLTRSGIVNTMDTDDFDAKFFNPVNEDVQEYICCMLEDLASYKDLDGIILDRGRFNGLNSDFSDYTKKKFEDYLGYSISKFPADVMTAGITVGNLPETLPTYFKKWLEFRAKVIHDLMEKASGRIKARNNAVQFGAYVGGWYSTYYDIGVNWASPDYNTASVYPEWAGPKYQDYGYADHMDIILIGAYASPTRIFGATEWTIQGFCSKAINKINGDAIVIGGIDVGNGDWATSSNFVANLSIIQSVNVVISACDGYFLFDMIHLKQKNQWKYVKQGIDAAIAGDN